MVMRIDPRYQPANQSDPAYCRATADQPRPTTDSSLLGSLGIDLVAEAAAGRVQPVVGREKELQETINILLRKEKCNPCLTGDAGVGKTAIVEGLAVLIWQGGVPEPLKGCRIISIQFASLVAGSSAQGQLEARVKSLIDEAKARPEVILFLDEIHTIIGTHNQGGGNTVAPADILKPALSRGEIRVIGATTTEEFRTHIARDAALNRRFSPVDVPEPGAAETEIILTRVAARLTAHHRVPFAPEAITAAMKLSGRYIADRCWPDKAIDLLDEAAAALVQRVEEALRAPFQTDRLAAHLAAHPEDAPTPEEEALGALPLAAVFGAATGRQYKVTVEDIADRVQAKTGIPVPRDGESAELLRLDEQLGNRVIGQESAIAVVADAIRCGRAGLRDPNRPVASFLFVGPTGVGKTEVARAVAEVLFGSREAMIRFDMSEFHDRSTASRFTGAPPGYIGYDEGGGGAQLPEQVRRRPYSLVLLDEIEKADRLVHDVLLQVLEDGRLTDGHGKTASLRETIIVMSSNVGAEAIARGLTRPNGAATTAAEVQAALGRAFRPEFLNRIDAIVMFKPLTPAAMLRIARLRLDEVCARARERGLDLTVTDEAAELLAERGNSPLYGARPLKRLIRQTVESPLATFQLQGRTGAVALTVRDGELAVA